MKRIFIFLLLVCSVPVLAQQGENTNIKGISIQFSYSPSIFPGSWLTTDIAATGTPISSTEISRAKKIISAALAKYPDTVLHTELSTVCFLKTMSMYHVEFGGTYSSDTVYLTDNRQETDAYPEQTFHHEFSSILYRNHPSFLDTVAWKAANGFDYKDPEAGVGAIRSDHSSQDLDTVLCLRGFLTQYACSGIENDINTIAQNLFKPSAGFWNIYNTYRRIKEKTDLLIWFYWRLNPAFTRKFFMGMK